MKNWKIVLPWNIPFSSKVLWVLVRKAKEEKGATFKGHTISVPPLSYQLSREHTLGWTVEESTESFCCWTDFNHLVGECHKHDYANHGIRWLFFIPFHIAKNPLLPISEGRGLKCSRLPSLQPHLTQHFELVLLSLRVYRSISYKDKQHGRLKAHSLQDNIFFVIRGPFMEVGNVNVNGMGKEGTGALFVHS